MVERKDLAAITAAATAAGGKEATMREEVLGVEVNYSNCRGRRAWRK